MSAQHAPTSGADAASLSAAERVAGLRAAYAGEKTLPSRGRLVDALVALAGERLALGNEDAAVEALEEAEELVPSPLPPEEAWQARMVVLYRAKAGTAQRSGRHADAVAGFEAAIHHIPYAPGDGGRDVSAARLQLLVRLGRSRIALGQASAVSVEAEQCKTVMQALQGEIPDRALETVRAAVLDNHGAALALLGDIEGAGEKFAEGLKLVERLDSADLEGLRQNMLQAWASALRAQGRQEEADTLLARSGDRRAAEAAPQRHHDRHRHHAHRSSGC